MELSERVTGIIEALKKAYPDAMCALRYDRDYELMVAARLSAQCTDARVNQITPVLFKAYPTLESLAAADVSDVETIIHSCGFYHAKARDIVTACGTLLERYGGRVPDTMEALLTLPGVGRKTANLLLGDIYHKPAVVCDTHCIRLSNRLGLGAGKDPAKLERQLRSILPPTESSDFCHRLVLHGRAVCPARKPKCGQCTLSPFCNFFTDT